MRNLRFPHTGILGVVSAVALAMGVPAFSHSAPPTRVQQRTYSQNYAQDRAEIEDLYGRYEFAFDWGDADTFASMFTKDGVVETAYGKEEGREALRAFSRRIVARNNDTQPPGSPPLRRARSSLIITNLVLKIEGDHATARAYWVQFKNANPKREATLAYYGHYADELVKINGAWLFRYRKFYNENRDDIASKGPNPAW